MRPCLSKEEGMEVGNRISILMSLLQFSPCLLLSDALGILCLSATACAHHSSWFQQPEFLETRLPPGLKTVSGTNKLNKQTKKKNGDL